MASIAVCNQALAEIRAPTITAIDDQSPEADACLQHYDDCLETLLECHEWGFAKKRVQLALTTNDRTTEWAYAYAAPNDLGTMGRVVYPFQAPLAGVYYAFDGAKIYTNLESAWLDYSSNVVDEALWPAMFRRALAFDLASHLAITLRDDRAMKGDLIQQYEAAKRRAMADDLNRYPRQDDRVVDEVALARAW
jgi:hypothetical protein